MSHTHAPRYSPFRVSHVLRRLRSVRPARRSVSLCVTLTSFHATLYVSHTPLSSGFAGEHSVSHVQQAPHEPRCHTHLQWIASRCHTFPWEVAGFAGGVSSPPVDSVSHIQRVSYHSLARGAPWREASWGNSFTQPHEDFRQGRCEAVDAWLPFREASK